MLKNQTQDSSAKEGASDKQFVQAPSISLPKGGGAIRGIGEKFAANPVTGTGSMTVPIATSPGRSGFGLQLSLSYDSGAGNGPFGLGWNLSLPAITRKTDKGLPRYLDGQDQVSDSDVFILSGGEDLVPVLRKATSGKFEIHDDPRPVGGVTYRVRRYRPRIEGLFARIERWTNTSTGETHWRSISKDNITTLYGKENNSRIFDPADPDPQHPTRVFTWLICQSYDDKGNAMRYEYAAENSSGIDLAQAHEANRKAAPGAPNPRSANRYLKRIHYGNATSTLAGGQPIPAVGPDLSAMKWLFEVVFDYGEGHYQPLSAPTDDPEFVRSQPGAPADAWPIRQDPFSTYRAGFEVRAYRLCRRVLMFHHFEAELGTPDYLVRSTEFTYREEAIGSFVTSVAQSGYLRQPDGRYRKKSLPPVEFDYTRATINPEVKEVSPESLENLPMGLDGTAYQWVDLDGEGVSGILTEQKGAWLYKRNLSPLPKTNGLGTPEVRARFAPLERVASLPALATASSRHQFFDLAGDGTLDLVEFSGPTPGFYERTEDEDWEPFTPFRSLPNLPWDDPDVRFVDLDGDGHGDVLVTEDEVFTWYRSLGEDGFEPGVRVHQPRDEERGPRLVSDSPTERIYLADLSGDGLTDLVRIRNGEVCYWPNLGYGRFGAKVTMDNSPWFDRADVFDQKRIRLADIDGSGTTDILYLGANQIAIYRNQSGNSFSDAEYLTAFPRVDNLTSVQAVDLLGNGTACLVWSSPLPGDARRPMRYIDLMGGQKPHLLVKTVNNLGAETIVSYGPSTKFYLQDRLAGKPWITKLPFPVHVVERVETLDRISRNHFVTRHAFHHGYFDGEEREFRGFGMVEQWDTEEFAALSESPLPIGWGEGQGEGATNLDAASHVPPVLTRTWFHTGAFLGRDRISNFFAGLLDGTDTGEYYREPGLTDAQARQLLLDDTVLPDGLTAEEEREACRALKGAMLRQEVYALDGTEKEGIPYTVTEQNFTIERLQPRVESSPSPIGWERAGVRADHQHVVFFTHPREAISYHYERNPGDPRISHAVTLEVDEFGNVLRSVAVGYPRASVQERKPEQNETHLTLALNRFSNRDDKADWYRAGLPVEARTYEVVKPPAGARRFTWDELRDLLTALVPLDQHEPPLANTVPYEQWDWRSQWNPQTEPGGLVNGQPVHTRLRLIEHVRTVYRKNDLTALSPIGAVESLALPGESYKLALTPGLIASVFKRKRAGQPDENLLPNPGPLLEGKGADAGGYVPMDGNWWIPSGNIFFDPIANVANPALTAAQEWTRANQHFFLPRKFNDPFNSGMVVDYDAPHDLLIVRTRDALANAIEATNDYRVLQPNLVTDPNRNRTAVAFDVLGMVVATAVMGKSGQQVGDLLEDFDADPMLADLQKFIADPHERAASLLGKATTRVAYDLNRFRRSGQPPFAATLVRETHFFDPGGPQTKTQISFSYSDGFGREIQKKIRAEAGDAPQRQADVPLASSDIRPGDLVRDANGKLVQAHTPRRWVGTGRTVFNNKGKPVRQYEPFFSATHLYEEEREMTDTGVSPVLFYDPVERVIATLHPNHTYEKIVFDPWQQTTYDVNDTVTASGTETGDPRTDKHIEGYLREYFKTQPATWPTWHAQRIGNQLDAAERDAALKAAAHADTPTVAHLDALGRTFLTLADNGPDPAQPGKHLLFATRVVLDIEGNQCTVIDAKNRVVMRYDYDMLGTRIHQSSMEAGERWMLNDVTGKAIHAWDSRRFVREMSYDELRRPTELHVTENGTRWLAERTVYGESLGDAANHRTRVYQVFDAAGLVVNLAYDFKGNSLRGLRQLATDYTGAPDWSQNPKLEAEFFATSTAFDALNRPLTITTPDNSIYRPTFNEANLLDKVDVNLRGEKKANGELKWTPFVTNINYNAKGQRELIAYGNGAETTYEYDPLTFRLMKLTTTRPARLNGLASKLFTNPTRVQDVRYIYDPVGNITRIADASLARLSPTGPADNAPCDYTYDAIYRLIEATGREHIGQTKHDFNPPDGNRRDYPFAGLADFIAHPNDLQGMRRYTERYEYNEVGNFKFMRHVADAGNWTRSYESDAASLIEPGTKSNRLTKTTVGNGVNSSETYTYADAQGNDVHGCMTAINSMKMVWDFKDQLQLVDLGGGGKAFYIYDAVGQRVRKVIETQNGTRKKERIYIGGFEAYRKYNATGTDVEFVRESLHVMDDKQRIALAEAQTIENSNPVNAPVSVHRYQFGNHLGSACMEWAEDGALISYEEYHPYGTAAFQAGRSAAEVSLKRYRYTGKERDEESGLYYHGVRYSALWIGRWISPDPLSSSLSHSRLQSISIPSSGSQTPNAVQNNSTMGPEHKTGRTQVDQSHESNEEDTHTFPYMNNPYTLVDNNPILYIDPDGKEPVRNVAGTVDDIVSAMNRSPSRVGRAVGPEASRQLLRMAETEGFFFPTPSVTPYFNEKRGRYVYTSMGGWIDMVHFLFYAGVAYGARQAGETDPVYQTIQSGDWQEFWDRPYSAYSYEDLPSDAYGALFGAVAFDPTSERTLGEQIRDFLIDLGATAPSAAPNWSDLPATHEQQRQLVESGEREMVRNLSPVPLYTGAERAVVRHTEAYWVEPLAGGFNARRPLVIDREP